MKIAHLAVGLLALGALATSCQQATTTTVVSKTSRVAAFTFFDAATGAKVDLIEGDVVTLQSIATGGAVQTISTSRSGLGQIDIDADQVKVFDFQNAENFVLVVKKTGYKDFEAHSTFSGSKATSTDAYGNVYTNAADFQLFNSVLMPSSISNLTPAYTITVRNANTGAAVTTGTYVIDLNTAPSVTTGTDTTLQQYTPPYVAAARTPTVGSGYQLTGTLGSTGKIDIAAGTLFDGQLYKAKVVNATGFADASITFTANEVTSGTALAINLTPAFTGVVEAPSLALLSASNLDSYGATVKNTRTITLTFNNAVEVTTTSIMSASLSNQLSVTTSDNDGDSVTTVKGTTTTPGAGVMPSGLTVTASGSTVVITLSATDVELTTGAATAGTLDTDDPLTWNLSTLFSNILVRTSGSSAATVSLNSVAINGKDSTGTTLDISKISQIVVR